MSEKLSITYEGKERELFMSYGLLNELTAIVGSPEVVPQISLNHGLRGEVMSACLAERKPSGKVVKAVEDLDDIDISISDAEAVVKWAGEAVLGFFVRSLATMAKQMGENKETFEGLKSSLDGFRV